MPKKLYIAPTIHSEFVRTVNLGTDTTKHGSAEIGKPVKLIGPDVYSVCGDGDFIDGVITSSEYGRTGATRGGRSVGGIVQSGYVEVVCNEDVTAAEVVTGVYCKSGLQPARDTELPAIGTAGAQPFPVKKATTVEVEGRAGLKLRIVGFGPAGTGKAGTVLVAQFSA